MANDYTVVQIASTHGPDQFLIWEGYQYGDVIANCAKKSDADRIVAALKAACDEKAHAAGLAATLAMTQKQLDDATRELGAAAARAEKAEAALRDTLARADAAEANLGIETLSGRHYERVAEEWRKEAEKQKERAEKYMWQVRDTCARAERAEAGVARLREAMREEYRASHEVCNQAEETRMAYGEIQMVEVPKWSIEWLKQAATVLDDALAPVEAKPCEYLDPPVCIDPSVCVSKCRFHGTVAEPHHALKGGDDGR